MSFFHTHRARSCHTHVACVKSDSARALNIQEKSGKTIYPSFSFYYSSPFFSLYMHYKNKQNISDIWQISYLKWGAWQMHKKWLLKKAIYSNTWQSNTSLNQRRKPRISFWTFKDQHSVEINPGLRSLIIFFEYCQIIDHDSFLLSHRWSQALLQRQRMLKLGEQSLRRSRKSSKRQSYNYKRKEPWKVHRPKNFFVQVCGKWILPLIKSVAVCRDNLVFFHVIILVIHELVSQAYVDESSSVYIHLGLVHHLLNISHCPGWS